jgi:tetratricopeptide (TPR) repeat protein
LWLFDEHVEKARGFFQKAAELDPGFAAAKAYQAYLNFLQVVMGFSEDRERLLDEGKFLAQKAMETDPRDPVGYFAIGRIYMMLGAHDESIAALKTALELNPNYAQAYFGLGFVQTLAGHLVEARKNLKIAVKLRPRDPLMMAFTNILGVACITAGDYEEAVEWSKRSLRWPSPLGYWNHATLAAAYAGMDRMVEAKEALQGALKVRRDLSISFLKSLLPTRHEGGLDNYWNGIRKAGLPE